MSTHFRNLPRTGLTSPRPAPLVAALLAILLSAGCSQTPAPPELPNVSPRKAANKAIAKSDTNDDGELDQNELVASGMTYLLSGEIDTDEDQLITSKEIAERIRRWQDSNTLLITATPTFTLRGSPLVGATVTLTPAEFLQPAYPTVSTVTGPDGKARFIGTDRCYPGVYLGFYTITVSKIVDGEETIPSMYNTESMLGFELSEGSGLMASLAQIPIMDPAEIQARIEEAQQQ